jgi:hypothetical protein
MASGQREADERGEAADSAILSGNLIAALV